MPDGLSPPATARFPGAAWLQGAWQAQCWMWSEAWCKWSRRPLPSVAYSRRLGDGQRFESHRGSWMGVLVPMVVFSQFVDVLIAQGVIQVAVAGPARGWLHVALLFVSLWTVVWAVSLHSAMRHVDHRLGAHALTLAVGFKHLCRLPIAAIAEVQVIDHRAARQGKDWLDVHQLHKRDVSVLTALDPPTLLIALTHAANGAWWKRNGVQRPLKRWVAVHVDQPAVMRSAVAAAMSPSAAPQP